MDSKKIASWLEKIKKVILVISIAATFVFSYKNSGAVINPFFLRVVSIVPEIDCLKINHNQVDDTCNGQMYFYDQGEFKQDATYRAIVYALDTQYHNTENLFYSQGYNNPCSPETKIILPNGIDWCDKNAVYKYFVDNKTSDYLVLGNYQNKFLLVPNKEFVINSELVFDRAYYTQGTQNYSNFPFLIFVLIGLTLIGGVILFVFFLFKKFIKHKR